MLTNPMELHLTQILWDITDIINAAAGMRCSIQVKGWWITMGSRLSIGCDLELIINDVSNNQEQPGPSGSPAGAKALRACNRT
jgi:hypothetical protein